MACGAGKGIPSSIHDGIRFPAQEYEKSQPVQSYDFVGLVQPGQGESGRVTVQQRNHFTTGETLECLTPAGDVFNITVGRLFNQEGEEVDKAPHPLEILTMETEQTLPDYTILRRPNHNG